MSEPVTRARYNVTTWDSELHCFSPQAGVHGTCVDVGGLRRALQELRAMGYAADYSSVGGWCDDSVLVERIDEPDPQLVLFED